jgi:hypothetical protein
VTTANELIVRALRLINQPGRGARLAAEDQSNAFEALQEILDSEAVTKQFVPGIRRHFFPVVGGKSIYTYGGNPGDDLDSSAFGNFAGDPAPLAIEYGEVLTGSSITDNELIDEYRFHNVGAWTEVAPGEISNNELVVIDQGGATYVPAPDLLGLTTYTIRMTALVNIGSITVTLLNNAVAFDSFILDESGDYEFDFVWPAGTLPTITVLGTTVGDDASMSLFSIIPRGLERLEIPDSIGSYYKMTPFDQEQYNRQFTKGNQGRPYRYLYTRSAGRQGDIRFDNTGVSGDIFVFNVLVNKVSVQNIGDQLRVNPQAIKWLRYALADDVAPEYGKSLAPRQISVMDDAWNTLASSNRRINNLGVPRGMRQRRRYDINRGDP